MSRLYRKFSYLLFLPMAALPQVGIGTTNIGPGSLLQLESTTAAFVLPRMTDAQMNAIAAPLQGAMVYDTSEDVPYFRGSLGWSGFDINSNPTLIMKKSGGTFPASTTQSYLLNLNSTHVASGSAAYFSVTGNGTVKVARSGVYLMSVSLATSNMPSGSRNYALAAYLNGNLIGYLSKSKLENPSTDYWGTTGTLMYPAQADDEISFKYFIGYNSSGLNCVFETICITKLN